MLIQCDLDLYVASGGYDPSMRSLYLRDRLFLNQGKGDFVLGLPNTTDLRDASEQSVRPILTGMGISIFLLVVVGSRKVSVTPNSRLLVNQAGSFLIKLKIGSSINQGRIGKFCGME